MKLKKLYIAVLLVLGIIGLGALGLHAASALTMVSTIDLNATYLNPLDLATVSAPTRVAKSYSWTNGTGASQANRIWTDTQSIAVATDIDLQGALVDAFGQTFLPTKLRLLYVHAAAANTSTIVLGGDANSVPFLDTAATTVTLQPDGVYLQVNPSTAGITVTAATGDIVQLAPGAGTQAFDIVLVGSQ